MSAGHEFSAPRCHPFEHATMGYGIIRIAKRANRAAVRSMLRHALRETDVANAAPGAPRPAPVAGDRTSGAALARLSAAIAAAPRMRKDAVQAVDVLVTATHGDIAAWPLERQNAYFAEALDFVAAKFGGHENILTAVIHRDETTPHMQLLIMPRSSDDGRFIAGKMIGGPAGLRTLQDDFHSTVSSKYGLMRGERSSKAKHVPIRQFYSQLLKADKPIPDYVEVPAAPTWRDKIAGRAQDIIEQKKKAIEHNRRVREALLKRASAASKIHPAMLERAAETYRSAVSAQRIAKANQESAQREKEKARSAIAEAKSELSKIEKVRESVERAVDAGWHLGTVDAFSATVTREYRSMLAQDLGLELRPGKLVDQVRRGLRLKTGAEAVAAIERVAQARSGTSFTEAAGQWAYRQEHQHQSDSE